MVSLNMYGHKGHVSAKANPENPHTLYELKVFGFSDSGKDTLHFSDGETVKCDVVYKSAEIDFKDVNNKLAILDEEYDLMLLLKRWVVGKPIGRKTFFKQLNENTFKVLGDK